MRLKEKNVRKWVSWSDQDGNTSDWTVKEVTFVSSFTVMSVGGLIRILPDNLRSALGK